MRTELVRTSALALFTSALLACGGTDEPIDRMTVEDVEPAILEEVEKRTGRKPSTDTTPCEILDDALVSAHFEVPADVEITRSPSKYSPHPLCTVSWPKPDAAEIQAQMGAAMSEYMTKKMRGEDVERPAFRTTDEISLTLNDPPSETPELARAHFESAMRRLSEGISSSHQGVEVTFQADLTPVSGVGDQALWAPKLRQLSVVDDTRIFHVTVNTGGEPEAELAKAKAVALDVAREL